MLSTMTDHPLTINMIFDHGTRVHSASRVSTLEDGGTRRARYDQVAGRIGRLAAALRRLGIGPGDRVATFCWNNQQHLEAYFAIPCMGAVLHTLNIRLFPEQLVYVANHAEDKAIIVDDSLVPLLARVSAQLKTVEHFIVAGEGDASPLGEHLRYESLLAAEKTG
ncbi:MAG: AMP-binding protein, partial [Deltaproteobacteria bacterium]|nr:AMP-binding protein [Deltaproteobacteria bacterium]